MAYASAEPTEAAAPGAQETVPGARAEVEEVRVEVVLEELGPAVAVQDARCCRQRAPPNVSCPCWVTKEGLRGKKRTL